jgi:hypothetical protein
VRDSVRERMRLAGIEAVANPADFHNRVTEGVRAWQDRRRMLSARSELFTGRTGDD